jgi:16S rRNA (cytidine1402-2'-O)-methyltransferase
VSTPGEGQLLVVATPIGNLGDLTARAREALVAADLVCCEDTRHTGRLLQLCGISAKRLMSVHEHNESARGREIAALVTGGATVCLVSDAGTPIISDPGARVVEEVLAAGGRVFALPGASAVLSALVVSGLSGPFSFDGFLERKGAQRRAQLEAIAAADRVHVIYEAPGRVGATLADLVEHCGGARRAAVCRELTKLHEEVRRGTLAELLATHGDAEQRGEFVIVVAPGDPAADQSEDRALEPALRALLAAGLSVRDAATAAHLLLSVPRRRAYDLALEVAPTLAAPAGAADEHESPGEG